jgi:hypothetical protein
MSPRHALATLALITAAALGATTAPAAAHAPADTPPATQGDSIWSAPADMVTGLLGPLGDSIW